MITSRSRRRLLGVCAAAAMLLGLALAAGLPGTGGPSRAAGQAGVPELRRQTDAGVPASNVTMIGATPSEAGSGVDETWGLGRSGSGPQLVRYARNGGEGEWSPGPPLQDESGQPLSNFELDSPEAFKTGAPSPLAAQMTVTGAGALVGSVNKTRRVLLVRNPGNPGNAFRETKAVPESELEAERGEVLFSETRAPLLAPLDEGGGNAGALLVPVIGQGSGVEAWVLHYEGQTGEWTREPIEKPAAASATDFRVLGLAASSPGNAWLLAQLSPGSVALFRRHGGGGGEPPSWRPVALRSGGEAGEALSFKGESLVVPGEERERVKTQVLTATEQGVWIDGERPEARASTTVFFNPGREGQPPSMTFWCSERSTGGSGECEHQLPEPLPTGPSRSIAWANSSTPYGDRVITGLSGGVTLRLEGSEFGRVLALGGSEPGGSDVGGTYGAAFSNPGEGWLGNQQLPVHLTGSPAPSRMTSWPVSFRHALVAAAPQPGVPVASLSSEALAVGDLGEVARYHAGQGWVPESLLGAGGRFETPRLRAVAWPTQTRAYAVGDYSPHLPAGPMWLWRGETGLWEPDPAAPANFRGNLLGIAFDPGNPTRGYAVGQSGVLLGFGKSWTQQPPPAEAPCTAREASNAEEVQACSSWSHANFTSVAFSGSQAIVAYRILPRRSTNSYKGGLLVNDGSGWHVDQGASEAMGPRVPWAVAGLADGGAAFSASGVVFERDGAGAQWHPASTPLPGGGEPGSLAPFREGGAMRVVASGSMPDTYTVESEPEPPAGFPPARVLAYPLPTNPERAVLRQTASGWSDEQHELNNVRQPPGNWALYDMVYQPDPIAAMLVDPSGGQGWAVGGFVEAEQHGGLLDTADIARYRDASAPPGLSAVPVTSGERAATFVIAGNATCGAPCANRAEAGIGPDVWLASAVGRASSITAAGSNSSSVRAFLYTGPRLPDPHAINGPKEASDRILYNYELERYARVLRSGVTLPTYAVATSTDLNEAHGEETFEGAFAGFPKPFAESPCSGCQSAYYAFTSQGAAGTVQVIVLDNSVEVDDAQLAWLTGELQEAQAKAIPAIVVGNADLNAEVAANRPRAFQVARALVQGHASAYFFDSPEQNVALPLRVGSEEVPTYGSGTLGYVNFTHEKGGAFRGASGFLVAEVNAAAQDPVTKRWPVTVRLVPNVGELAMEAKDGLLLRRSQAALFSALARRPRAGNRSPGASVSPDTDPYIPIPSNCVGTACSSGLFPEYTFTSSNTDIGNFVKPNLASPDPKAVLLEPRTESPIPDEHSGLFCAYNPGTTIVTITAGGLSASLPVTVQAGSVRRPCGTTRLKELPVSTPVSAPPPAPAPAPQATPGGGPAPTVIPAPPPALISAAPPVAATPPLPAPAPFFVPLAVTNPLLAALPPPVPTPARPTPPSGTSAVTQPVEAPEKEEEQEEAPESVSNKAVAYHASDHQPSPAYVLGIVVLAALAGASIRRPRRGRREVRVAPATVSTIASQRRASRAARRHRR
jgi:hypothetical protein